MIEVQEQPKKIAESGGLFCPVERFSGVEALEGPCIVMK
jgi:hypothetical protein